ncbi:cation diffusion facilitator CzcD-associated flavoprotein CzcO [Couchioplanes caeruleus]|nr:cation diffusion facilitator CzcD-associated flavoprotein CzcO [Couchioplanes caeruleus]
MAGKDKSLSRKGKFHDRYERKTGFMAEHFDVLIIGAGLSGIGAAWRLRRERPGTTYAILEARTAIGGTWDLFRYPGVRSDSDMFTLSYPFRPWRGAQAIASGESIRAYIRATAEDGGIMPHIRFGTKVLSASWADSRWTVTTDQGTFTCTFLYACAGYYDYAQGYQPDFAGLDDFRGTLVHPQFWPEDLDYSGKRVVVIGSGATAVTVVPAMAGTAAHVTMLQRSPTYMTVLPERDVIADLLRRGLPPRVAHTLVRAKNVLLTQGFYQLSRRRPERVKALLRRFTLAQLGDRAMLDEHFTPTYQPWDQRLCVVPDGDLFTAIKAGTASVVTAHIDRFVPEGIRLTDGRVLEADVVVSATGLSLLPLGGVELTVDGEAVEPGRTVAYRGVMLSGVPNFAYCIGYTNASWTLRADLSHRYVLRLLSYMARNGYTTATPQERPGPRRPLLDLTSGYVQRSLDRFPSQGDRDPWTVRQNYLRDVLFTPRADVRRDMTFGRQPAPVLEEIR